MSNQSPLTSAAGESNIGPSILLLLCFAIACHFYGPGINLSFLLLSALGPVWLWWSAGPRGIGDLLRASPQWSWLMAGALALIGLHHLIFSISPDTSYPQSWVLASLPIWALAAALADAGRVARMLMALIGLLAAYSAGDYLLNGQRAYAPLSDPSNYATLIYLAWIPWVLDRVMATPDRHPAVRDGLVTGLVCFIACLTLLATQSRFAALVIGGVCLLAIFCGWRFAGRWSQVAALSGAAILAGLVFGVASAGEVAESASAGSGLVNGAESTRLNLLASTWEAFRAYGGVNGLGLGSFVLVYPSVRALTEQETTGQFVHNDFAQLGLEGGIWLLVPLLAMTAWVVWQVTRNLLLRRSWQAGTGYLVAVAVALVHSTVNFVFYILPLTIVVGVWLAAGMERRVERSQDWPRAARPLWIGLGLALTVNVAYLGLDVFVHGVFTGQKFVPFAESVRSSPERMLQFARLAGMLNERRAVPVLAEARLLDLQYQQQPSAQSRELARLGYRAALNADSWNPLVYNNYFSFQWRSSGEATGGEHAIPLDMLRRAQQLDPADDGSAVMLIQQLARQGDLAGVRDQVLRSAAWCELLARHRPGQYQNLYQQLSAVADILQDPQIDAALQRCQTHAQRKQAAPPREKMWLLRRLTSGV